MTVTIRNMTRYLIRFAVLWLVDAVSLTITAFFVPGMTITSVGDNPWWLVAIAASFLLGIVNFVVRPLVLLIAMPLGFIGVFIVGFLVNALVLMLTSSLLPGFRVEGLLWAIVAGVVLAGINLIFASIMDVNEEGSLYQNTIERLARRQQLKGASEPGRGLVILEIDGLSYHHMKKALADGYLPTLSKMMAEEGYELSHVDCGLPSQTSACQAGIMFGDNHDIPAFRWFDKDENKLYQSGQDAEALNSRYAKGNGLLRGGSAIVNMMAGDAEKSMLTVADLRTADKEHSKLRAQDMYLLMLHPTFLMRTLALFFGDVGRELWQGWQQRRHDVQPRLNRLAHGYPFVRAGTTVFVREVAANLAELDIVRGAPAIYVTWPGYDEVAHHSGPWTDDAFQVLKGFDHVIARMQRAIKHKAPRPYDLILLSDHGQSFGATFKQRYGLSIKEFIESQLPEGVTVAQMVGGDTGVTSLKGVSGELENMQDHGVGNVASRAVVEQSQKMVDRGVSEQTTIDVVPAEVTAYGSGNLAQVYFNLYPRRIKLSELEEAFPGMVDALVTHEGIGFVAGYDDDGVPVVLCDGGRRNLHSGEVQGKDPLAPYANPDPEGVGMGTVELRAWQVRRVMDFPHAGDLMVNSTVFEDGTVAALEELIGNHGGLGGEQTDAFLFHPGDMDVPPIRNSAEVFDVLNTRRGQPVVEADEEVAGEAPGEQLSAWEPRNFFGGLARFTAWIPRALRALTLDTHAYREVADDAAMTGPAVLIALVASLLVSFVRQGGVDLPMMLGRILLFFIAVLAVFGAGRLLTGKGSYTRTLRALGFAEMAALVHLFAFIPAIEPVARIGAFLLALFTLWMGAAVAHDTRGVRTLLLPVLALVILVVGVVALAVLLSGAEFTIAALLGEVGAAPAP